MHTLLVSPSLSQKKHTHFSPSLTVLVTHGPHERPCDPAATSSGLDMIDEVLYWRGRLVTEWLRLPLLYALLFYDRPEMWCAAHCVVRSSLPHLLRLLFLLGRQRPLVTIRATWRLKYLNQNHLAINTLNQSYPNMTTIYFGYPIGQYNTCSQNFIWWQWQIKENIPLLSYERELRRH